MRYSTIEIRWHDTLPMYSVDAQPFECETHKRKINPYQRTADNVSDGDGKLWRLATAGGDKKVRIWLAIPSPPVHHPQQAMNGSGTANAAGPSKAGLSNNASSSTSGTTAIPATAAGKPKVEYMATLDKHTLTVNVVRFSPAGHLLATAGDDAGTAGIFIWRLSANAPSASFGSRSEDAAYEREAWQAIKMIKTKSPEIYDLVWSPDGEYLLTGGTDAAARVYRVADGVCVAELTDHKDWVQGVAWDPLNKYIATQGKDRAMHIYSIDSSSPTDFKVKLVSKNAKITTELANPAASSSSSGLPKSRSGSPSIATASTPALDGAQSTSTSSAAPLASTSAPTAAAPQQQTKTHTHAMYGDEESSPFFRRLAFSTDGSLLLTPTGLTESSSSSSSSKKAKRAPLSTLDNNSNSTSTPSIDKTVPANSTSTNSKQKKLTASNGLTTSTSPTVYMYSRGGWENDETPIAHLPGHRTTSIVVKFNPILWDLRKTGKEGKGKGKGKEVVDAQADANGGDGMQVDGEATESAGAASAAPAHASGAETVVSGTGQKDTEMQPATTAAIGDESATKSSSDSMSKSIFSLKQRSIYAVASHETILIYDTQQALPICMFGSLHFAAFTDLAWTGDGLTLIATSSDGYASIFTFEDGELGTPSSEQPKRSSSRYEEALLANAANFLSSSPVKPSTSTATSAPTSASTTAVQPPIVIGSSPEKQPSGGGQTEGEVIVLDGDSQETTAGAQQQSNQKVKKRAALTFVSPLGGGSA